MHAVDETPNEAAPNQVFLPFLHRKVPKRTSHGGGAGLRETPISASFSHRGAFWSPGSPRVAPRQVQGVIFLRFCFELGSPGMLFSPFRVRCSEEEIKQKLGDAPEEIKIGHEPKRFDYVSPSNLDSDSH